MSDRTSAIVKAAFAKAALAATAIVLAPLARAADADTDPLKDLPSFGDQLIHTAMILLGLIVLLVLVLRFLPRARRGGKWRGNPDLVKVIHVQTLDMGNRVYLLRVAGSYILVGASREGLHTLAGGELNAEAIDAAIGEVSRADPKAFDAMLRGAPEHKPDSDVSSNRSGASA